MATETFYWREASGGLRPSYINNNITVTYPDNGSGDIVISSDPNETDASRTKTITLTSVNTPAISRSFTVTQRGEGEPVRGVLPV